MSLDSRDQRTARTTNKSIVADDAMVGHFLLHGIVLGLYALSLLIFWAFGFQPIFGTGCGLPLIASMMIFSLLAYGPSKNALEKGNRRGVRRYKVIWSPLLAVCSVISLVAIWIMAFNVAYDVSVFA